MHMDSIEEQARKRKPTTLYCKFNETHVFKTFEDRERHEQVCPQKAAYEQKWEKSQMVYNKFKTELKSRQHKRKGQMEELFGHNNGPTANEMPTLHYKYRMNEPFVDGERGQYQISHEQNDFKKKVVYGLDDLGRPLENQPMKTAQDEINEMKSEWNQQLLSTFQGKCAPDISTLLVKQDQTDMFGLKITARHCSQVNHLFEFDIDEYISFM